MDNNTKKSIKKGLIIALFIVGITVLAFLVSENPLHLFERTFQGVR